MDTLTKNFLRLMILSIVLMTQSCTAIEYSAAPIEAWVVDAETKKPLEGVNVVAHWVLEGGLHTDQVGELIIMEAVTDANGRFYFPAWGPLKPQRGLLDAMDPELLFFKSGYEARALDNSRYSRPVKYSDAGKPAGTESKPRGAHRISFWSGETVPLKRFTGTLKEYSSRLNEFNLDSLFEDCGWKKIPHMVLAISHQSDIFRQNGVQELYVMQRFFPTHWKDKCGSQQEFFKDFKP